MFARLFVRSFLWIGVMALLLFAGAGSWRWAEGWAFLAIFTAGSVLFCAWLWRRDPALLAARLGPVVQQSQPLWDKIFMAVMLLGWNAWLVAMALDARRWRLSDMPPSLEVIGGLLIAAGFAATMPVFAANSFAAPVVRVQAERGQRVIDTGPYALVRHPMYAAAMLYLVGLPLLLGSWYGLIGSAVIAGAICWRAVREERTLVRDLPGYADYLARVPWRLVPYVW